MVPEIKVDVETHVQKVVCVRECCQKVPMETSQTI